MKDREIIEKYLKSLKDELLIYHDSLSEKSLDYICKLKKQYNHWEKDLDKLDGNNIQILNNQEVYLDETFKDIMDEYLGFVDYYEEYKNTNSEERLEMARTELSHFISLLSELFEDINVQCADDLECKTIVKNGIKNIYTKF